MKTIDWILLGVSNLVIAAITTDAWANELLVIFSFGAAIGSFYGHRE